MCRRLDELEKKVAYFAGKESLEGALAAKSARIAYLEDEIIMLKSKMYTDEKTCHKLDAHLMLRPQQMGDPYHGKANVIETRPFEIIEKHEKSCGE